jgi:hypothetical protein
MLPMMRQGVRLPTVSFGPVDRAAGPRSEPCARATRTERGNRAPASEPAFARSASFGAVDRVGGPGATPRWKRARGQRASHANGAGQSGPRE